ncbi:diphthine--ammonia ligase [Pontibacter sp. G13]|uniref:Dph6-related ATP pyrophosphatase n=1 Tax=Pontibacter sp. G13 TaxID=3074898 RepID=UPI00288BBE86|nr:diphthine--ammonia ligase [Pontibacter sp. G13]WNJ19017.1 diphthine--ammonia ligase [Pontibacter sp. G13]
MNSIPAIMMWSGGKDSSLALQKVQQSGQYLVQTLVTTVNEKYDRISMHGVRADLLRAQAASLGIDLHVMLVPENPTMEDYDRLLADTLKHFRQQGIEYVILGDIFLEDLRAYRDRQFEAVGMQGVYPLWKGDTSELMQSFIDQGFRGYTSCVSAKKLGELFVGRELDAEFVHDLPEGVDPCGENGEFHSFVFDGPIYSKPIPVSVGEKILRTYQPQDDSQVEAGFWYADLIIPQE